MLLEEISRLDPVKIRTLFDTGGEYRRAISGGDYVEDFHTDLRRARESGPVHEGCVEEVLGLPRPEYAHLGSVAGFTVAAHDAQALKAMWAAATGWEVTRDDADYVVLTPADGHAPIEIITRPTMPTGDDRKVRIHLDVAPGEHDDQAEAVESLIALGATRADIGQTGDENWVVLADPEGNEFCVLSPRP